MTVDPRWQIDTQEFMLHTGETLLDYLKEKGAIVPDVRLQALADAWNEPLLKTLRENLRKCGFGLADLLDALTEDDNDE